LPENDLAPTSAPSAADAEIEKRKARAAKFGVPYVEPTAVKAKPQKPSTTVQNSKPSAKPASATVPAEDPEVLARRRAKFGIPEPVEKNKKNGTAVPAAAQSPSPADP
jgi:SAP domain-containing ribonucleoprotein